MRISAECATKTGLQLVTPSTFELYITMIFYYIIYSSWSQVGQVKRCGHYRLCCEKELASVKLRIESCG